MPPKRGARAGSSRGGGRAASRTPGPSPLPSNPSTKLTTAYGSPAPNTSSRTLNSGSASGAISHVLDTVDAANRRDRVVQARTAHIAQVQIAADPADLGRQARVAQRGDSEDDESDSDHPDTRDDRSRMPPPPRPSRGNRINTTDSRSGSDNRSFIEERGLFTGAGVDAPRRRGPRSETPSRSSARVAAKKRSANLPSPLGPAPLPSIEFSETDDSAENDDPFGAGVPRAYEPDVVERMMAASRQRGAPRALIADRYPTSNEQQPPSLPSWPESERGSRAPPPASPQPGLRRRQSSHNNDPHRSGPAAPPAQRPEGPPPPPPRDANEAGNPGRDSPPGRYSPPGRGSPGPGADGDNQQQQSLFDGVSTAILQAWQHGTWQQRLLKALRWWGYAASLCVLWLIFLQVTLPPARWEGVRVGRNQTYTALGGWRQSVAQFIPWVILHPFAVITGTLEYADFRTTLQWLEWTNQHQKFQLEYLGAATAQMRSILPELIAIKVDRKTKEWAPGDAFWDALTERMKQGGLHHTLPTLEKSPDGSYIIADDHWGAIRDRIHSSGLFIAGEPNAGDGAVISIEYLDSIIDRSLSRRWNEWLQDNEDAIKRAQGADTVPMTARFAQLYGELEKTIEHRLDSLILEERIISREEFIDKVHEVSNEYGQQIRAEMKNMDATLQRAVAIIEASRGAPDLPAGLTREQLSGMVNAIVEKAVADAQLEAIAKGNIQSHLETELLNHKNYFSTRRGAIVDKRLSSSSYLWTRRPAPGVDEIRRIGLINFVISHARKMFGGSSNVNRRGGKYHLLPSSPSMALERWEEDGECWCAGHTGKDDTRIADLAIFTADTVIPQHLVVEHISASGTFDPEAMPKDLEVWIRSPDGPARRTLMAWSNEEFHGDSGGTDPRLLARGFVKIGEFTYDNDRAKGEKQLFKLSEKLIDFGAQTEHVLVRSKSNYGAEDHTCFYRIRLLGEPGKPLDTFD